MTQTTLKANRTPNSMRPAGARNKTLRAEAARRRAEAQVRSAEYTQLTPQQRLERLDQRLGKGVGATRERTRLAKMIAEGGKPLPKVTAEAIFNTDEAKKTGGAKKRGVKGGKTKKD